MLIQLADIQDITETQQIPMVTGAIRIACNRGEAYVSVPRLCKRLVNTLRKQGFTVKELIDSNGISTQKHMITW
jgi:hypothetical protein